MCVVYLCFFLFFFLFFVLFLKDACMRARGSEAIHSGSRRKCLHSFSRRGFCRRAVATTHASYTRLSHIIAQHRKNYNATGNSQSDKDGDDD